MESIFISFMWKAVGMLPEIILKYFYSTERLAKNVEIDVRPRHEGVKISQPDIPSISIWLQIRNSNPFSIVLDRINIEARLNGRLCDVLSIKRIEILGNKMEEVYLTGDIPAAYYERLKKTYKESREMELDVYVYFYSKAGWFEKEISLSGVKPNMLNESALLASKGKSD